ncbi:MAG: M24 family metallopeptidase, partial [Oscillospiraceae bacterium]
GNYLEGGLFSEIITYEKSLAEKFVPYFERLNPNKVALDFSENDTVSDGLTLGLYLKLEKMIGKETLARVEVSAEGIIREMRSVKTPTEIKLLRQSIQITNDIYDEVWTRVRCGMSEKEIGDIFVDCMKKRDVINGLGAAYSYPIVCIVRAGLGHRGPGDTKTIPGDIVIMDFSVNYKGYISDIARTAYILKPEEKQPPQDIQHAFDTAFKAISNTINFIGEGRLGHEVDAVGRKTVEEGGFPTVRHSVGHPIGRACHDSGTSLGPIRAKVNKAIYRPIQINEVYAIEPTVIQDDGLPCMLVEENVVITQKGAEILSRRQTQLYLIQG